MSKEKPCVYTKMVGVPGLEPGTSALSGRRSSRLSYTPASRVGVGSDAFSAVGSVAARAGIAKTTRGPCEWPRGVERTSPEEGTARTQSRG